MAASKWPPYSSLPHVAPNGTVCEPLSGRFSVICRPEEGGEGIQRAIDDCEEGGSILLREGVYHVMKMLRIDRSVHIFGRGRAELRGCMPRSSILVLATSDHPATLYRLRVNNLTQDYSYAICVASGGRLRLQGCNVSSHIQNRFLTIEASGASAVVDILGCTVSGGGAAIGIRDGAAGRIEGCVLQGFTSSSMGILLSSGASPHVARNRIRNFPSGVRVRSDVDPAWSLGEGNVFESCLDEAEDGRQPAIPLHVE